MLTKLWHNSFSIDDHHHEMPYSVSTWESNSLIFEIMYMNILVCLHLYISEYELILLCLILNEEWKSQSQGSIWGLAFWSPWDSMGPQKWSPLEAMWSPKLEAHNPCYFQDVLSQWSDNVIKHINICFYCIMFYHNSKCIQFDYSKPYNCLSNHL